ncbi:hypothetical protein TNCV_2915431 [Trichonephila clavipes]|nr:hypothetical protein TNCV_2915431 [Trichonephila clavipes]
MSIASTRRLLATDHVILNHGQVTWTTPELALLSPNYHTTPTGGRLALDRFNVYHSPIRWVFSGTGLKLMTCLLRFDILLMGYHSPETYFEA